MSGHSKWSTIKRQKGKTDAQRGKIFTKLGREIAVAVKNGGSDPACNSRLRDAIAKAKAANMPSDNMTRGIKKAAGELGAINYEEVIYEGYGPSGIAFIVEALTDNKNRTAGEVRHIFDRSGGAMGAQGCVGYLFETKGVLQIEKNKGDDDDQVMMQAIDSGAADFFAGEDFYEIQAEPSSLNTVRDAFEKRGAVVIKSGVERIPASWIDPSVGDMPKLVKMLDAFDDNDDVQQVFHNANLPDDEE